MQFNLQKYAHIIAKYFIFRKSIQFIKNMKINKILKFDN